MRNTKEDASLIGCKMDVPDPRAPYNQRHKFIDIVIIAIMAVICGMDTWNEIEDWAHSKKEWLGTFLELPGGIPSHDTINRVFQMLDPEQFHRAFFRWTGSIAGKIQGVVAIDGKTVRRSRGETSGLRPIHVVSAWANGASLVLGQLRMDEKTNEIKAIPELLEALCLEGCTVTIDAMGTQKEIAKAIVNKKADYILQVKGNQPALLDGVSLYFKEDVFRRGKKELEAENRYYKDTCFEHGRLEVREYYVENDIRWLNKSCPGWEGLHGIGACVSRVTEKGNTTETATYSIYSRPGMTAEEYGKGKRAHWGIENSLHGALDIGFREDESRIRSGNAAENINVVRHIGLNLLKQEKSCRMGVVSKRKKCNYRLFLQNTVQPECGCRIKAPTNRSES